MTVGRLVQFVTYSWPSSKILPWSTSYNRMIRLIRVDFPVPEAPTSPIISPGFTEKLIFSSTDPGGQGG